MVEESELKGQKRDYDPDFEGPLGNRHCTDVLFLIVFAAFWVGMFIVAGFAVENGDIGRLIYPRDSFGNVCGIDNTEYNDTLLDMTDKEFLYIPDISDTSIQICVESCPKEGTVDFPLCGNAALLPSPAGCNDDDHVLIAINYDEEPENDEFCCAYESNDYFYRCLPIDDDTFASALSAMQINYDDDSANRVMGDLALTWHWILLGAIIAVVLGFVWLVVVQYLGGLIVWVTIFMGVAGMAALAGFAYWYAEESEDNAEDEGLVVDTIQENADAVRVFSYILFALTFILILIIIFMRKRIQLALGILEEAGNAIKAMPSIVFYPILTFLSLVLLVVYWLYIALYLASAWKDKDDVSFGGDASDEELQWVSVYHFFGLLWSVEFVLAFGQVVLAGSIATYYWTRDKRNMPTFPVLGSLKRTIQYHMGSIALGSLILAIVQMIRAINAYLQQQVRNNKGTNQLVECIFCCITCCLKCVESIVRFLNKNAYIMIAIYGYSFCKASRESFQLLFRNMARVLAVSLVGDFLMFLGKLFIACLVGIIGIAIFQGIDEDLSSWVIPAILNTLVAYAVASGFMSVYEMAISTILLCFCEDIERNDPKQGRDFYMSDNLYSIMDSNANKARLNRELAEENKE